MQAPDGIEFVRVRRAFCRGKVRERELVAAQLIVGASAQIVGVGARAARDARVVDEQGEVGDGMFLLAALDHRCRIVKDAPEAVTLLELCADLGLFRALRTLIAGEERIVLALQVVAFFLQTCELRFVLSERREINL